MNEQRSQEWFAERAGKFTGSQISKLIAKGRNSEFSQTGMTYIKEKVAEILTNGQSQENKSVDTAATRWGVHYEQWAVKCYQQFTFNKVHPVGFLKHETIEHYGASPDGLIEANGVLEVKCPFTSEKHVDFLLCDFAEEILEVNPDYYFQVYAEMDCAGATWADFVSYDPRCDERTCLKIIRFDYNQQVIDLIQSRVKLATQIMYELLNKIGYEN